MAAFNGSSYDKFRFPDAHQYCTLAKWFFGVGPTWMPDFGQTIIHNTISHSSKGINRLTRGRKLKSAHPKLIP